MIGRDEWCAIYLDPDDARLASDFDRIAAHRGARDGAADTVQMHEFVSYCKDAFAGWDDKTFSFVTRRLLHLARCACRPRPPRLTLHHYCLFLHRHPSHHCYDSTITLNFALRR